MGFTGSNRKLLDFVHYAGKLDVKAAIIINPVKNKKFLGRERRCLGENLAAQNELYFF